MSSRCQSCGMPIKHDPQRGGTNATGKKVTEYCSYCYQLGRFTDNFTSAGEMRAFIKDRLKDRGVGPIMSWLYTIDLEGLKRWKR